MVRKSAIIRPFRLLRGIFKKENYHLRAFKEKVFISKIVHLNCLCIYVCIFFYRNSVFIIHWRGAKGGRKNTQGGSRDVGGTSKTYTINGSIRWEGGQPPIRNFFFRVGVC